MAHSHQARFTSGRTSSQRLPSSTSSTAAAAADSAAGDLPPRRPMLLPTHPTRLLLQGLTRMCGQLDEKAERERAES